MPAKTWVLLLTDLYGAKGGIPTFNQGLVDAFREIAGQQGWTLKVLVLNDKETRSDEGYESFSGNRFRFVWEALRAACQADGVLLGHVHFTPLALIIPSARRWLMAHGIEVWGPLSLLRRLGLSRMDRILCVSQFTRDQLVQRHGFPAEKTALFPNTARLQEAEKQSASAFLSGGNVILTVSRLWPQEQYKKIDRVIEAMPAILAAVPETTYVIVGEGADRSRLENLARQCGVSKHVVFAGSVTDQALREYYRTCDVFVLPSLGEGFGIVFLEAMICGKPCVGAAAGAVPEVIDHDRTGLIVAPDNAAALGEALIRLLSDKALCASMGEAGRQRFHTEFAYDRFRERLAQNLAAGASA